MAFFHNSIADEFQSVNQLILTSLKSDVGLVENIGSYIVDSGGKRLRPVLVLLGALANGYSKGNDHIKIAAIIEFIHTATLLHDDVVDVSALRRGRETANEIWGNAPSVLVGDFLYSRAFQMLVEISDMSIMSVFADATNVISEGEVQQMAHAGNSDLDESTYEEVIFRKTAKLLEAGMECGAILAGTQKQAMKDYGKHLGMAFQIADDALDYYAKEKFFGKQIGKDFYEGKVTLPLITIFQKGNEEEKEFLTEIMKKEKRTEEDFSETLALINKYKAVETSLKKAEYFVNVSYDALAIFSDSEDKRILQSLTSFSLNRSF